MTERTRMDGDGVYLPVPEVGEERTHVEFPECETGEVPIHK